MTHTDELRGRNLIREVVDTYAEPENFPRSHVSPLAESILQLIDDARADERKDVHADIAARAMSDEVVEAVTSARHGNAIWNFEGTTVAEGEEGSDEEIIAAMLLALGITESEAEG